MEPIENIEAIIRKKLHAKADVTLHDRVLARVRRAYQHEEHTTSALCEPAVRRSIMKSPITKLAVAAAIIAAVVLGLFEFIGGDGGSGVVWAEVAERLEASEAVIYRVTLSHSTLGDNAPDYSMSYLSATRSRQDAYKGAEVTQSIYCDFENETVAWVGHEMKRYSQQAMDEQTRREQHGAWSNPTKWVQEFLSRDYTELGQKTIDDELCDGIEITDPTFVTATFAVETLVARVWVSVETGYPVLLEGDMSGGGIRISGTLDQFQWDAELDESLFEPEIPEGYEET
jgi:hypothetical protein